MYDAELIGTDPSNRPRRIKIKETNLRPVTLGSSKRSRWVNGWWRLVIRSRCHRLSRLVLWSAKGRRINIVEDKFPLNRLSRRMPPLIRGNSGGALVNKNGELGGYQYRPSYRAPVSYTGYAFAVPVDIAKKIVNELDQVWYCSES